MNTIKLQLRLRLAISRIDELENRCARQAEMIYKLTEQLNYLEAAEVERQKAVVKSNPGRN